MLIIGKKQLLILIELKLVMLSTGHITMLVQFRWYKDPAEMYWKENGDINLLP